MEWIYALMAIAWFRPVGTVDTVVPPIPTPKSAPTFESEVAGRRLLMAAGSAIGARPGVRWHADTKTRRRNADMSTEAIDAGSETFEVRLPDSQWVLSSMRRTPGRVEERRMVRGGRLIACMERASGTGQPTAQGFVIDAEVPDSAWPRVAEAVRYVPRSAIGRWAIQGRHEPSGTAWLDSDGWLYEVPRKVSPNDPDVLRRYRFRDGTSIPTTVETWTTARVPPRSGKSARAGKATGPSITYALESIRLGKPTGPWMKPELPADCRQVEPPPLPAFVVRKWDPSVHRALKRWNDAWSRPLALAASVDLEWRVEAREGRGREGGRIPAPYHAELLLRRPGRLRVDGSAERGQLALAIGDSEKVLVRRTVPIADPERPWTAMAAAGAMDSGAYLDWFFGGPPDFSGMDAMEWVEEPDPVSGLVRRWLKARVVRAPAPRAGERASVTTEEWRIGFGSEDLPVDVWWSTRTRFEDTTDADQPPLVLRHVRWTGWRLDKPVDDARFRLP